MDTNKGQKAHPDWDGSYGKSLWSLGTWAKKYPVVVRKRRCCSETVTDPGASSASPDRS